ncbi:MAG: SIS domain-containing protein [Patescibacteria group bacterium]|jgi:glucose/mannose-6-phosphate isomerase
MLDTQKTYATFDKEELSFGIEHLPEQVKIAWEETRSLSIPSNYRLCDRIVVIGMGGSALGPHIVQSVFFSRLKVPLEVVRGYTIPASVNAKTLVILSSFSGGTEEVLAAAKEARRHRAKMVVIATGGALLSFAKREHIPFYAFKPGDLAKEPRLGVGFSMIGIVGILERAGFLKVATGEIRHMTQAMSEVVEGSRLEIKTEKNAAKTTALELKGRNILVVASEHLTGNAHLLVNQINEVAKQMAFYAEIPELNHHLMEGLTYPKDNFSGWTVLMLHSSLYYPRIEKRYSITADIFEKQGGTVIDYEVGGGSVLEESGEVMQFGSFVAYYLAMLNEVNPKEIPFVKFFKDAMGK